VSEWPVCRPRERADNLRAIAHRWIITKITPFSDRWVQLSINRVLRRDCRVTPPQTRGSRSAFAVIVSCVPIGCHSSRRMARGGLDKLVPAWHSFAGDTLPRPPSVFRQVNSKSPMNLGAVRGANGKRSTWPVPVSVPHKACTAIDTLLTFCPSPPLPISVRSSGLTLVNVA
jgi:hypothetical protein